MFRWLSSKLFGVQTKEEEKTATNDENFEDAIEALESNINTNAPGQSCASTDNVNNSAATDGGQESESSIESKSKPSDPDTNDTSVWENVEISRTETQINEGNTGETDQNMSTWENVEMTTTSPTVVINEVSISSQEQKSDKTMQDTDSSIWENIEINNGSSKDTYLSHCQDNEPGTGSEMEINVQMLTSAIESEAKNSASESKKDLLAMLSNRSINKEMKQFAEKSDSEVLKKDKNETSRQDGDKLLTKTENSTGDLEKIIDEERIISPSSVEKSWRQSPGGSKDRKNKKISKNEKTGHKEGGTEATEEADSSPGKEEPEDFLTMVKRKTSEGNLVWAKKLVYGLGHLKGVDNKEIESYLLQQYEIAINKRSHGWIKDARYHAEIMYSRRWIDENLPTMHQRNRNKDKESKKQERKREEKEEEMPPKQERQSRFTGMCQDVRLLSNPDLPVVRSNAANKRTTDPTKSDTLPTTDKDKQRENDIENGESNVPDEKLQNFNEMKSAIEEIISKRSEKPKVRKSDKEQSGVIVKAVTDADQIIQTVQVSSPVLSDGDPCQVMTDQGHEVICSNDQADNEPSELEMDTNNSNIEGVQMKDCVVKLERLPGYYHVKSPKIKSPDKDTASSDLSYSPVPTTDRRCKSPTDVAKTTPKRRLSGSCKKKPWISGDEEMAEEDIMEDHNYARWIGNENGCKMTVSSEDLKTEDDCIVSYGKPVMMSDSEIVSENKIAEMQKFVQDLFSTDNTSNCQMNIEHEEKESVQKEGNTSKEVECAGGVVVSTESNEVNVLDVTGELNQSDRNVDCEIIETSIEYVDNKDVDPVTKETPQFQDQFLEFCQQESVPETTDTSKGPTFQNEFLQFCQTKE